MFSLYDLGALYRTLFYDKNKDAAVYNSFLGLSFDKCRRIWDLFVGEHYKDEPEETLERRIKEAELIGTVLAMAKHIKTGADPEVISGWAADLEGIIDKL